MPQATVIQDAAAQIVALINGSPRSPSQEEIAAILAKAVGPARIWEEPALALQIRDLFRKTDDAYDRAGPADGELWPDEAAIDEADRYMQEASAICEALWAKPPRSLADLYVRAVIAEYWHKGEQTWEKEPKECDNWGDQAVAELIKAVLEMGPSLSASDPDASSEPPAGSKRITCAADIDFEPVLNPENGKPITFDYRNVDFANAFCPTIRMAFILLGRDRAGVRQIVKGLSENPNDPDASALFDLLDKLERLQSKFAAISALAQTAWARTVAIAEALDDEQEAAKEAVP